MWIINKKYLQQVKINYNLHYSVNFFFENIVTYNRKIPDYVTKELHQLLADFLKNFFLKFFYEWSRVWTSQ